MDIKSMKQVVGEQAFFQGLDPAYLDLVSGCASHEHFKDGDFLFKEGAESDHFYIVTRGQVSIETYAGKRGAVTVQTIGAGDLLGWSWLVPPYKTYFDARALQPVTVIRFDGTCLRGKCETDSRFGYEMLNRITRVIVRRLRALMVQLVDVYQ